MLCARVAIKSLSFKRWNSIVYYKSGDDDSWEVRRPKILGIEVQGQSHGYFFYINIHTDIVG